MADKDALAETAQGVIIWSSYIAEVACACGYRIVLHDARICQQCGRTLRVTLQMKVGAPVAEEGTAVHGLV